MEAYARGGNERVEFFRSDADRQWYFRRVAANNEIQAESEGYQNHADALATAAKLFPDVPWFRLENMVWSQITDGKEQGMATNEDDEGQTVTEGEEVDEEPEFDPEPPQQDAPADVEEGPEPTEPPVEE